MASWCAQCTDEIIVRCRKNVMKATPLLAESASKSSKSKENFGFSNIRHKKKDQDIHRVAQHYAVAPHTAHSSLDQRSFTRSHTPPLAGSQRFRLPSRCQFSPPSSAMANRSPLHAIERFLPIAGNQTLPRKALRNFTVKFFRSRNQNPPLRRDLW